MGILEDQRELIWKAIEHWRRKWNLSTHHLSLLTAGRTKEPYSPARIDRGITYKSEPVSEDLVRACLPIFRLVHPVVSARERGTEKPADQLTVEDCVEVLTAPVRETPEQGKFRF